MAKNPTISQLDPGQIIKRVYDEANDVIRTTVDASVNIDGQQTLVINHAEDSIVIVGTEDGTLTGTHHAIKVGPDGTVAVSGTINASNPSVGVNGATAPASSTEIGAINGAGNLQGLKVDEDGALLVNAGGSFVTQQVRVIFNEVTALAVGTETTINTYTAPIGYKSYLLTILNSGGNRAVFNIFNNGNLFDKQYTQVSNLSALFDYKTGSSNVPGVVIPVGTVLTVKAINNGTSIADFNSRFLILEVT